MELSYTPNENFTGSDTFTYKVNDGTVDSPGATVTVDVQALPNKPPTAAAVSDTVVQDQSKDIALKASDPDVDDKLQFSIVNGPQNGQLGEINQENGTVVIHTKRELYRLWYLHLQGQRVYSWLAWSHSNCRCPSSTKQATNSPSSLS